MDGNTLVIELRENEFNIFLMLKGKKGKLDIEHLSRAASLSETAVVKALLTLSKLGFVKIEKKKETYIRLSEEGSTYANIGLPETRLVKATYDLGGISEIEVVAEQAHIKKEMIPIVLGWIKRKNLAAIESGSGKIILKVSKLPEEAKEERLIKTLQKKGQVKIIELEEELQKTVPVLKKRNLVEEIQKTKREVILTNKGNEIPVNQIKMAEGVTALTTEFITSGDWKKVKILEYDVTSNPPTLYPGKKHFFSEFMEEARELLLSLGFEEYDGPFIETEFWNFDVLFQAQDHPAREIHDSYMLKEPKFGTIENEDLLEKVKKTHENGWTTGSRGWRYDWSAEISSRLVLRTQTTAVSMRYLNEHKTPPIKMFCLSKVFRPDVLDAKHSMEFTQLEGIIGDRNITFRNLLGLLKEFAKALNLGEVKFRPGYFPFTEPSVESFVKHPKLGWVEFVGSGMFRPEVLIPLGIDFPVIAWGIGFDRLAMIRLGIDDIRELYTKKLDLLREKIY